MQNITSTVNPVPQETASKPPYTTPKLEQHQHWVQSTGISLPIGTLGNPLEENQ